MSAAPVDVYRKALAAGGCAVREESAGYAGMPELEWQARWFAGEFGSEWEPAGGLPVRILDFGRWNREPGPDFVGARVCIGTKELRGDIELDPDARDWERHGHATNPAYRNVVLHVFACHPARRFFTRTSDHREVAQLPLPSAPGVEKPAPAPAAPLLAPADAPAILHAAARHRLELKARVLQRCAAVHGEDDAWFAAFATALGYKHNKTPFLLLAQRAGLRAAAKEEGEALLFGIAGFLESPAPPETDAPVRAYLRRLWEGWWSRRAASERWILPAQAWRLAGIRPANHPHRRVGALARIAVCWPAIHSALAEGRRTPLAETLESIEHPFWTSRFNLQAAALAKPQALLGSDRIRDIVINIFHPLALARDETAWSDFLREKGPAPAAVMRKAADRFFGRGREVELSLAVSQQGLLQLERDCRAAADPAAFLGSLRRLA